jgi:LysM repeat protein
MTAREFGNALKQIIQDRNLDLGKSRLYASFPVGDDVASQTGLMVNVKRILDVKIVDGKMCLVSSGETFWGKNSISLEQFRNVTNAIAKRGNILFDQTQINVAGQEIAGVHADPRGNISVEVAGDELDESLKDITFGILVAGILTMPGVLNGKTLATELDKAKDKTKLVMSSPEVKKAMDKSLMVAKTYDGLNASNTVNMIARTLFAEAGGKDEGTEGRKAVLSVIWNRANHDVNYVKKVITKPSQFSCWNKYTGGWTDKDYKFSIPASVIPGPNYIPANKRIWDECVELSIQLVEGNFESTIGNMNSYLNKAKARKSALETWGKLCTKKIGSHHFGFVKSNQLKPALKIHVVKSGDSLSKIAKEHNTDVSTILTKNPTIKDPNHISIGQKIFV